MKSASQILVCITGATNSGKSSLVSYLGKRHDVGLIEIGKILRKKYPPSYFKGQQQPKHTEAEVLQLLADLIDKHVNNGVRFIVVDGQPRSLDQLGVFERAKLPKLYIHLFSPEKVRIDRIKKRDGNNAEALALSMTRLNGDIPSVYEILLRTLMSGGAVRIYDTSSSAYSFDDVEKTMVGDAKGVAE